MHGVQTLIDGFEALRIEVETLLVISQHVDRFLRLRLRGRDDVNDLFQTRVVFEQAIEP